MGSKTIAVLAIAGLLSSCAQDQIGAVATDATVGGQILAVSPPTPHVPHFGLLEVWTKKQWWRGLGQLDRDEKILARAFRQNGQNVGVQCKEWARTVIVDASQGGADIPATANNWSWKPDPYARLMPKDIKNAQPAWVIQMETSSGGPHTAFIVRQVRGGVDLIDSNYVAPLKVGVHTLTYDKFKAYSVYQITGGP